MTINNLQGEKLRLSRLYAGLTLAQLGDRVGASRQYIHQLEAGNKISASYEMIEALADALEVYPAFLVLPLENDVKEEQCHFRSLKSTLVSTQQQVIAHGTLFDQLIVYLENRLSLPKVDFPQLDVKNTEDIEHAAQHCREHWQLTRDQPITNMIRVVENAGAVVTMFDGIPSTVDAFSIDRARPIIIRSTFKQSPSRLRFDIAHECGHLVMHRGIQTGDNDSENEANRFASAFLLPRDEFIKQFPKRQRLDWIALFNMKKYWKVSVQAIIRRAFDLGLINSAQYKTACAFINKNGYKKNEPYEPKEHEKPELAELSLNLLREHLGVRLSDLAAHMGLKPIALAKLIGVPIEDLPPLNNDKVIDINRYRGLA
jgi:Zn-dependent peptidase ImmA (M78 family)/transcriptional regulator with XRE-family HTH domain